MDRLIYKKFNKDDFIYFEKLAKNQEVMKMNFGRIFTDKECSIIYTNMMKCNLNDKIGYFKVYTKEKESYIGLSALTTDENITEAEIEYMILPEFWRKGYGTEIAEKMISNAKSINSIKKITGIINPFNEASRKILLNNGFKFDRSYITSDNTEAHDFILYL